VSDMCTFSVRVGLGEDRAWQAARPPVFRLRGGFALGNVVRGGCDG